MIDQAQIHAEFTDAAELAEQFARLSQGASVVFCRGPGSWARFPHATATLVQGWIDDGRATVLCGRDPRDGRRWLHRVYRKAMAAVVPALPVRSALAFERGDEGQVWALLRDLAADGAPCPTNEEIAVALDLETPARARSLFDRLKAQGRVIVIEPARFGPRVIEVVQGGDLPNLRTRASGEMVK